MKILRSLTFWSILSGFILTMALWYIQMWTPPLENSKLPWPFNHGYISRGLYKDLLWPKKIEIAFFVALLLLIVQLIIGLYPRRNKNQKWIKSIINHIFEEKFHGDLEHTRITVFKVEKGISILIPYIWRCFIVNFFAHWRKNLLKSHFKLMPNPLRDYLVIYTRRSNPHEKGTSTFFLVASNPDEVCGIASHSIYIGAPYKIEIDSISDIPITEYKNIDSIPKTYKRRVREYMVHNKLKNFDKLKCFHRLSNNIWANPIYDKSERTWGVIVIDNASNERMNFDTLEADLKSYTRILGLSILHLN